MKIKIPKQLQNKNFRFLRLKKKSKSPLSGMKWLNPTEANNLSFKSKELLEHNGNYGVIAGYGNLRILDIDDKKLAKKLIKKINTFTVQTCGGAYHFYFKCDYNKNKVLKDSIGEYRANNYYVVGPGSYAIDKKKNHEGEYKIVKDIEIKKISIKELFDLLNTLLKKQDEIYDEQIKVDKEYLKKNILPTLPNFIYSLITEPRTKKELQELGFPSRSERDQKVITSLLLAGYGNYIKSIFENFQIGDKYREHKARDVYLNYSIKCGRKYSGVKDDKIPQLENKINSFSEKLLRNKIEEILEEIDTIDNELYKKYFISLIAFKIHISKNDLLERLNKIKSRNKIRLNISLKELLKKNIPKPNYWMYPIIPRDSLIFIAGMPESFKSLFCLILVLHMQDNKILLDNFETKKIPRILYYDLENGEKIQYWRTKYIINGNKIKVNDNFHFYFDFDKQDIKKELKLAEDYDIIILDSYRRFLEGEENKSEVVNKFYNEFLFPLRESGKTVLIIHHLRKMQLDKLTPNSVMNSLRGSGDIGAQPDIIYGLIKHSESISIESGITSFDISVLKGKCRNIFPIQNFRFNVNRDDINESTILNFKGFNILMNPKDARQHRIVEIIENAKNQIMKRIQIVKIISAEFSCSEIVVDKDLKELVELDKIHLMKKGIYALNKENTDEDLDIDKVQQILK